MLKIGSIPYRDKDVEDKRHAGLHKPVFLHPGRGGYRIVVRGFSEKQMPPIEPDIDRAIKRAKKWVQRRRGSCLKRPTPAHELYAR